MRCGNDQAQPVLLPAQLRAQPLSQLRAQLLSQLRAQLLSQLRAQSPLEEWQAEKGWLVGLM